MRSLKRARVAEITAEFNSNIKSVWNIVTNNNDYSWRSDIKKMKFIIMVKNLLNTLITGMLQSLLYPKRMNIVSMLLIWKIKCLLDFGKVVFQKKKMVELK